MANSTNGDSSPLNARQEAFAVNYAESGNGAESYRAAYGSPQMSDATARSSASRLLKNANVLARIAELRNEAAAPRVRSISEAQAELSDLMINPKVAPTARISAAVALLKSYGAMSAAQISQTVHVAKSDETVIWLPPLSPEQEDDAVFPDDWIKIE